MRGSAHILKQKELLEEEYTKFGITSKVVDDRVLEKELREYEEADYIHVLSKFAKFITNFGGQIALSRILNPEDFGVFALASSIARILLMLFGFGFSMACIQLQDEDDVFDTGMIISLGAGVAVVILGGIASFGSSSFYQRQVSLFIFIMCCMQLLKFPASIYSAYQRKEFLFRRNSIIRGVTKSPAVLIAVGLAWWGWGSWSLISRGILSSTK